jgi:formylglycine-generating enzyme required for sulfatase activity
LGVTSLATIFISHSSKDDNLASQLEAWLHANGFTDVFIDHSSIVGGAKWADALRDASGACRAVLCLVTDNWLNSIECFAEFRAAGYMGKRVIPLFVLRELPKTEPASRLLSVYSHDQGIDITPVITSEGKLNFARDEQRAERLRAGLRAAGALMRVGLDPEAFSLDRATRPTPFPGLQSFGDDDADAAVFYGRSREIAEVLEVLRGMRAISERRVLVVLGASGAGKSSLLKAGVIPRLRRETPAWLPLRAFRPGADPLLNFAQAVTRTLADFAATQAHGAIRLELLNAWKSAERLDGTLTAKGSAALVGALDSLGKRIRAAAARPESTILVSVDQAEELARAEGESGDALADFLRAMVGAGTAWRLMFAIRTDSLSELQSHPRFHGIEARGHDLRALPVFRFDEIVEAPARRYGVEIDPALTDALMDEAPRDDALPLLAFALRRLWDQFGAARTLRLQDYRAMGGLSGLIEDAAERALCGIEPEFDTPVPPGGARAVQVALGERTFVPPLADVNDEGAAIRRVAQWANFDEEQKALLTCFDRWRLVVRRKDIGGADSGGTIEVAHDALFREWGRLRAWLEPERVRLEIARSLSTAAASWERKGRQPEYMAHFGERLFAATALEVHERYAGQLDETTLAYLSACRAEERRAGGRRRRLVLITIASILLTLAGSVAYSFRDQIVPWLIAQTKYRPYVHSASGVKGLDASKSFQDCRNTTADCPVMVVLPTGQYWMGSGDDQGLDDERPRRRIGVESFAVSKYEITFANWAACAENGGCSSLPYPSDWTWGRGQRPVINVSWDDAQGYVKWLSEVTGEEYRLLTEAEWEYAARARTSALWSSGDLEREVDRVGWFADNSAGATHQIGRKPANMFGLHDMHGNVLEWVEDCYAEYDATKNLSAMPPDGLFCSLRVLRGGAWNSNVQALRSAYRLRANPTERNYTIGFRVARTLTGRRAPVVLRAESTTSPVAEPQLAPGR